MEESTYQEHHTMKRVTLKSSSTNLNGESRINYNILGIFSIQVLTLTDRQGLM